MDNEGSGDWAFAPTAYAIYRGLIERLEGAGAEVFVAHYDWRQSNSESVGEYLIPAIEAAKQATGAAKVDIVAHSMGGIVARDYIQGTQYNDDVDQLVMIGTPNRGASDAYIVWEGGNFPDRWGIGTVSFVGLVENALKVTRAVPTIERPDSFRTFFPSLHDLLPIYEFAEQDNQLIPASDLTERNVYLESLAATEDRIDERGVADVSIAGTNVATVDHIPLSDARTLIDQLLSRWRDGRPNPDPPEALATDGDKTVLASSAQFGNTNLTIPGAEHDKLPEEAQEKVLGILGFEETGAHIAYELPQSVVGAVVLSPVDPVIMGPNGETLSKDTNTFTDAEYVDDPTDPNGPKLLSVSNPPPGGYTIQLTGTDTGDYTVITSFANETGAATDEYSGTTTAGQVDTYSFTTTTDETAFALTAVTVRDLTQQMVAQARLAVRNRLISGREMSTIMRPGMLAISSYSAYERSLARGREQRAARALDTFHQQLDQLAAALDAIAQTPGREDVVTAERALLQQLRLLVPTS